MHAERTTRRTRQLVTSLAIVGLAVATAYARGGGVVHVRQRLAPTGADRDARGKASLDVRPRATQPDSTFQVAVRGVDGDARFDVLVGGMRVGSLTSNASGKGRLRLRSRPRAGELRLGVDPRGRDIVVRDGHGDDVLGGHCPEDGKHVGQVACCLGDSSTGAFVGHAEHRGGRDGGGVDDGKHDDGEHDDGEHELECRYRTPDECAQQGGTVAGDSCAPDPCVTTVPPVATVRCCIAEEHDEDGEGGECETRTPEVCAAAGGTMVTAASCDPNPCEPTPPAVERIQCCETEGDGAEVECEHRTAAQCDEHHGVGMGPGTCNPNPCAPSTGGGSGDGGGDPGRK